MRWQASQLLRHECQSKCFAGSRNQFVTNFSFNRVSSWKFRRSGECRSRDRWTFVGFWQCCEEWNLADENFKLVNVNGGACKVRQRVTVKTARDVSTAIITRVVWRAIQSIPRSNKDKWSHCSCIRVITLLQQQQRQMKAPFQSRLSTSGNRQRRSGKAVCRSTC